MDWGVVLLVEDVMGRLRELGVTDLEEQRGALESAVARASRIVSDACNLEIVPEGLRDLVVDMACGEFLFRKKNSGQLPSFDAAAAVKSVKEGDTQIAFAQVDSGSPVDELIQYLRFGRMGQIVSYRRLSW